jgi:asparagine synthetase B (glutamine-hydrolysing)
MARTTESPSAGRINENPQSGTRRSSRAAPDDSPSGPPQGPQFGTEVRARDRALFESAVSSRLDADVPLGLFLSGGLDSALIAAIAKQHRPDIKAFTVRMPYPRLDESEAAAETAAHLGLDHTIIDCDPNAGDASPADDLVALIEQLGLPFGDSSLLPTHWVCRAAREHVTVALSGDGGDELFGGYARHAITPTLNRFRRILRLIPDALLPQKPTRARAPPTSPASPSPPATTAIPNSSPSSRPPISAGSCPKSTASDRGTTGSIASMTPSATTS